MMLVCSVCQRYLGTRPPYRDPSISREVCSTCTIQRRRDLSTLVISRERGEALPFLASLFRGQPAFRVVIDRRNGDRRREIVVVDACRRSLGKDRRQTRSLRLV